MPPHQCDLRKGRSSEVGRVYAITKCVDGRKPVLTKEMRGQVPADAVVSSLKMLHTAEAWSCFGYVVMPDHVHFVIKLLDGALADQVGRFSKCTGRSINAMRGDSGTFWQAGYFDHAIRGQKSLSAYLTYMVANPVRAALVVDVADWPWTKVFPDWKGSASGEASYRETDSLSGMSRLHGPLETSEVIT